MNGTPVVHTTFETFRPGGKSPQRQCEKRRGASSLRGAFFEPRAGPTLLATRIRVKAGAGHEKAPGYHTKGANFLSELFVTSRTLRARRRCVKGRDIRCAAGWMHSALGAGVCPFSVSGGQPVCKRACPGQQPPRPAGSPAGHLGDLSVGSFRWFGQE